MEQLSKALQLALTRADQAWRLSPQAWEGDTADAYHDLGLQLVKAANEATDRADVTAKRARAYQYQLERCQQEMADYRTEAAAVNLRIEDDVIMPPPPAPPAPTARGVTRAERDAWDVQTDAHDAGVDQNRVYCDLAPRVQATHHRLETWIEDNLQNLPGNYTARALAGDILLGLPSPDNAVSLMGAGAVDVGNAQVKGAMVERSMLANKILTSSDPSIQRMLAKNGGLMKALASDPLYADTLDWARCGVRIREGGKWASKVGGPIVNVAFGIDAVTRGASPTETMVTTGTNIGAGIALDAAGFGGPIAGSAAVGAFAPIAAATIISVGAGKTYVALTPQDIRERYDDEMRDATRKAVQDPFGTLGQSQHDQARFTEEVVNAVLDALRGKNPILSPGARGR